MPDSQYVPAQQPRDQARKPVQMPVQQTEPDARGAQGAGGGPLPTASAKTLRDWARSGLGHQLSAAIVDRAMGVVPSPHHATAHGAAMSHFWNTLARTTQRLYDERRVAARRDPSEAKRLAEEIAAIARFANSPDRDRLMVESRYDFEAALTRFTQDGTEGKPTDGSWSLADWENQVAAKVDDEVTRLKRQELAADPLVPKEALENGFASLSGQNPGRLQSRGDRVSVQVTAV